LILIITFIFSIFAAANILLPIFATIPKLRELKSRNLIKKPIPTYSLFIAPAVWSACWILGGTICSILGQEELREFAQGSFTGAGIFLLFAPGQKNTIEREIFETYKDFLAPIIVWNVDGDIASEEELRKLGDAGNKDAANALAFYLCWTNDDKKEEGIKRLRLLVDQDFDPARVSLATILMAEEKYREAVDVLEPAAERGARNSVEAIFGALIELDEFEEAEKWRKRLKKDVQT